VRASCWVSVLAPRGASLSSRSENARDLHVVDARVLLEALVLGRDHRCGKVTAEAVESNPVALAVTRAGPVGQAGVGRATEGEAAVLQPLRA